MSGPFCISFQRSLSVSLSVCVCVCADFNQIRDISAWHRKPYWFVGCSHIHELWNQLNRLKIIIKKIITFTLRWCGVVASPQIAYAHWRASLFVGCFCCCIFLFHMVSCRTGAYSIRIKCWIKLTVTTTFINEHIHFVSYLLWFEPEYWIFNGFDCAQSDGIFPYSVCFIMELCHKYKHKIKYLIWLRLLSAVSMPHFACSFSRQDDCNTYT